MAATEDAEAVQADRWQVGFAVVTIRIMGGSLPVAEVVAIQDEMEAHSVAEVLLTTGQLTWLLDLSEPDDPRIERYMWDKLEGRSS